MPQLYFFPRIRPGSQRLAIKFVAEKILPAARRAKCLGCLETKQPASVGDTPRKFKRTNPDLHPAHSLVVRGYFANESPCQPAIIFERIKTDR
jgi:hypothetical protein